MNYRDWMKFQKSFFKFKSSQLLVEECIAFFTKAVWPNNQPSKSLIVGFSDLDANPILPLRVVEYHNRAKSIDDVLNTLNDLVQQNRKFDFILFDFRHWLKTSEALAKFLSKSENFYQLLAKLLEPGSYCGVLVGMEGQGGGGFPLPWSVALACRDYLRLRDEKVGLIEGNNTLFYCLFMQATKDELPTTILAPEMIRVAKTTMNIPGWTMPKPPPRKPNEILHPAKYPETLIEEFIKLFTREGDNVFDPMVGTGSTVVAATRAGRNGYGIDLNPEYVKIARERVEAENQLQLFETYPRSKTLIVQGDSTKLNNINEFKGHRFQYAVTSPPYWSMLKNPGSENQRARRKKNLPLVYSQDKRDLGNISDYHKFICTLESVYNQVADKLEDNGYLTIVLKNVKKKHVVYPLAWDLAIRLSGENGRYDYVGNTLWCQDDVGLKPFAVGIHWVSNTLHQYCLHFKKRKEERKS